jgi:membrane dipeptidase
MLIVDSHQDLAWNMLTFGRDYTKSVAETRRREAGTIQIGVKEDTLLGYPDYRRGQVALIFATLFAAPERKRMGAWETMCYRDFSEAHRLYSRQLDVYHRLVDEHPDLYRLIQNRNDLESHLSAWNTPDLPAESELPVGLVILMEGAEGILAPAELEDWWQHGVRLIGPAWAGTRYCGGTREPGPLTPEGFELLEAMSALGFTLDLSHMDEIAALQALDVYSGAIVASHSNARALLKGDDSNRHLNDRVILGLLERDGVIGIVPYNGFLQPGWIQGNSRENLTLQHIVAQIDAICQLAGDARHVGLGTDFDGGFGWQSVPHGIDTIADLQKLAPLLAEKGYTDQEITAILGENWLHLLRRTLPGSL